MNAEQFADKMKRFREGTLPYLESLEWRMLLEAELERRTRLDSLAACVSSYGAFACHNSRLNRGAYIAWAKDTRLVKIGSSIDIRKRLTALATGSPAEIVLVGVVPADEPYTAERALHERFHESRSHGEWFTITEPLISFLRCEAEIPPDCLDLSGLFQAFCDKAKDSLGLSESEAATMAHHCLIGKANP